jgi:hypothetical protein
VHYIINTVMDITMWRYRLVRKRSQ